MDLDYSKNNNSNLFKDLEKMNLFHIQNYVPIYDLLFKMNADNCNSINLEIPEKILSLEKCTTYNSADVFITTKEHTKKKKNIFFKFAPLVDPIRYMAGKYKDFYLSLPTFENKSTSEYNCKVCNPYNCAYIDAFFTYVSSQLLNSGFKNALNFHGMYVGYHKNLKVNIIDDLEFLTESSYFHNNLNVLFQIENEDLLSVDTNCSGENKNKITIGNTLKNDTDYIFKDENIEEPILNALNLSELNALYEVTDITYTDDNSVHLDDMSSTCSSASSLTDYDFTSSNSNDDDDIENDDTDSDSNGNYTDESTEMTYVEGIVNNIPVSVISMEKCTNTLDSLLDDDFSTEEWISCLSQVIFTLALYQKKFNFTHNDLHTSNIMYVETKKKYLNYKINEVIYKVPTLGKLYKIIDFGRSIYTFKNMLFYSDAFNKKEDAATQYNFGPFFDDKKQEVKPNFSFDLSRLGCSLYDYFEDYTIENENDSTLVNLIKSWCQDDKGKNILYKSSGEERYPEFKLYKMIARTVHNCVPHEQLTCSIFDQQRVDANKANTENLMDLDNL